MESPILLALIQGMSRILSMLKDPKGWLREVYRVDGGNTPRLPYCEIHNIGVSLVGYMAHSQECRIGVGGFGRRTRRNDSALF